MITFRLAPHTPNEGDVVEVWDIVPGNIAISTFLGSIYPNDVLGGITVRSRNPLSVQVEVNNLRTGEVKQ